MLMRNNGFADQVPRSDVPHATQMPTPKRKNALPCSGFDAQVITFSAEQLRACCQADKSPDCGRAAAFRSGNFVPRYPLLYCHISVYMRYFRFTWVFFHKNDVICCKCCPLPVVELQLSVRHISNSNTAPRFGAKSGFEMCFGPSTLGAGEHLGRWGQNTSRIGIHNEEVYATLYLQPPSCHALSYPIAFTAP